MNELFLRVLNLSITASWLILAILLFRVFLKKAPKWSCVLLWAILAVRLLLPFSIESPFSLIPNTETIPLDIELATHPSIDSGLSSVNRVINPVISESFTPTPSASINPLQVWVSLGAVLWAAGVVAMLLYTAISYWKLYRKTATAVLLWDNIFQSEYVRSPFVLGILKPRIYLPFELNDPAREYVIAHEQAHIRRRDHWWKPLGFLLLTIHWFNPLMWLAYALMCRDMELACDESVIRKLGSEQRADYTQALVACSVTPRMAAVCPLAFGEIGVKERIRAVLNYKKPAFRVIILVFVLCAAVAICFLTSPATAVDDQLAVFIDCEIASHHQNEKSANHYCCLDWDIIGKTREGRQTTLYMWVLYEEFSNQNGLVLETGSHILTAITVEKVNRSYSLVEYWEPKDGSYYLDSIREKVPVYLWSKAMDSQRYIDAQSAELRQMAQDHFGISSVAAKDMPTDEQPSHQKQYYLTIGEAGVYRIEISTPYSSGGCRNANGRPFKKGETIWLEPLDGITDLKGVTITATDEDGYDLYSIKVSDFYQPDDPDSPIICGHWVITPG